LFFIFYCKLSQNAPKVFVFRPMFEKLKLTMLQDIRETIY